VEVLELNRLYNMDCMEGMKQFPDKYFELAIVDPPYGIGMDGGNVGYQGFNNFQKKDWDSAPPSQEYFTELFRVSKNQVIWGGNYFGLPATRCYLIWDKGAGFKNRTYAEAELAWTSFDANVRIYQRDPLARGDYHGKIHPTQKPIQIYAWILNKFAQQGDKILDTHVGSASSLIACYNYKFDFIGFEIDEEYYRKAQARMDAVMAQVTMF
jgi:site-specific DNA-methyltransferase (adenine-specific)